MPFKGLKYTFSEMQTTPPTGRIPSVPIKNRNKAPTGNSSKMIVNAVRVLADKIVKYFHSLSPKNILVRAKSYFKGGILRNRLRIFILYPAFIFSDADAAVNPELVKHR
jgi:hypothetical protein